jgi:predicted acyltransferase
VTDPHNTRDPEGLLGDIPALGTALLGMLTAFWLRSARATKTKAAGLAVGAAACLALGYLWSIWFPLNKNMWTSSYVLVAAGYSLTAFTLIYWLAEVLGWGKERGKWLAYPWLVFGSNAITAYMFSELVPSMLYELHFIDAGSKTSLFPWSMKHIFSIISNPGWAAFAFSVSFCAVCFVPVWLMHRKRIFLKI